MTTEPTKSSLLLLTGFLKTWYDERGDLKYKRIKCRLWFSNTKEMMEFVNSHQEEPNYIPPFDDDNEDSWTPYYTQKVKFDK